MSNCHTYAPRLNYYCKLYYWLLDRSSLLLSEIKLNYYWLTEVFIVAWEKKQTDYKYMLGPRDDSPENVIWVCAALKALFWIFPDHFLRLPFQNFSVLHDPEIKVQFLCLKYGQIPVLRTSNWTKNQFFKTPNVAEVHPLWPYFPILYASFFNPKGLHTCKLISKSKFGRSPSSIPLFSNPLCSRSPSGLYAPISPILCAPIFSPKGLHTCKLISKSKFGRSPPSMPLFSHPLCPCGRGGGNSRFGLVRDVPLAAQDPYPCSGVIFQKIGTHI